MCFFHALERVEESLNAFALSLLQLDYQSARAELDRQRERSVLSQREHHSASIAALSARRR